jgi:hypothetical protein
VAGGVQRYIAAFRIKELEQVLIRIGQSKSGRKAELTQRLLRFFNRVPGGYAAAHKPTHTCGIDVMVALETTCHPLLRGRANPTDSDPWGGATPGLSTTQSTRR